MSQINNTSQTSNINTAKNNTQTPLPLASMFPTQLNTPGPQPATHAPLDEKTKYELLQASKIHQDQRTKSIVFTLFFNYILFS